MEKGGGEEREGRRGGRGKEGKGGRLRHGFWGMDAPGYCTLLPRYNSRPNCYCLSYVRSRAVKLGNSASISV